VPQSKEALVRQKISVTIALLASFVFMLARWHCFLLLVRQPAPANPSWFRDCQRTDERLSSCVCLNQKRLWLDKKSP
jgi:hypothetical protein